MITSNIAYPERVALEEDYAKYGEYRIVVTVRHTGTHSIKEQFPGFKHWHCNPTVWELIEKNPDANIITTYRDPLRVAASWYNRSQLPQGARTYKSPQAQGELFNWRQAWFYYGKILKVIPESHVYKMEDLEHKLYTHPDSVGAHKLLDNGSMEEFFQIVDKDLTDYAYEQLHSNGASYDKHGTTS